MAIATLADNSQLSTRWVVRYIAPVGTVAPGRLERCEEYSTLKWLASRLVRRPTAAFVGRAFLSLTLLLGVAAWQTVPRLFADALLPTQLACTGPTDIVRSSGAALSATLTTEDGTPLAGRSLQWSGFRYSIFSAN